MVEPRAQPLEGQSNDPPLPGERRAPYHVFLSVCSADYAWGDWFAEQISRHAGPVFFAPTSIPFGANWRHEVDSAIAISKFVILVLSPEALLSEQCQYEWEVATKDDINAKKPNVIPVMLRPVPLPSLPSFVSNRQIAPLHDQTVAARTFKALLTRIESRHLFDFPTAEDTARQQRKAARRALPKPAQLPRPQSVAKQTTVAIYGAGYVGICLLGALAGAGYEVVAVEKNAAKRQRLRAGRSHVLEPEIDTMLEQAVLSKRLRVWDSTEGPVGAFQMAVVCLGPSILEDQASTGRRKKKLDHKKWDTRKFVRILKELSRTILTTPQAWPVSVVIAGTIRPQDYHDALNILEQFTDSTMGSRFVLAVSPLFVREASILADLRGPPFIITGTGTGRHNAASKLWRQMARDIARQGTGMRVKSICLPADEACVVKLASNAFHALKVCFANEVGRLCQSLDVDGQRVMKTFVRDQILNVSRQYLKPGFAFGGWCLEKDIIGLFDNQSVLRQKLPLLSAIVPANRLHLELASKLVEDAAADLEQTELGILGVTFKTGSDDVRASPALELMRLLPKHFQILAYDEDLSGPPRTGLNEERFSLTLEANRNITVLDLEQIVSRCHIIVLAKRGTFDDHVRSLLAEHHVLIDLVGDISVATDLPCQCIGFAGTNRPRQRGA